MTRAPITDRDIEKGLDSTAAIQHVGVNHGALDSLVTEQFLNGADV
jgi:hypothetical protein